MGTILQGCKVENRHANRIVKSSGWNFKTVF